MSEQKRIAVAFFFQIRRLPTSIHFISTSTNVIQQDYPFRRDKHQQLAFAVVAFSEDIREQSSSCLHEVMISFVLSLLVFNQSNACHGQQLQQPVCEEQSNIVIVQTSTGGEGIKYPLVQYIYCSQKFILLLTRLDYKNMKTGKYMVVCQLNGKGP